eukprot:gene7476-biopygen16554
MPTIGTGGSWAEIPSKSVFPKHGFHLRGGLRARVFSTTPQPLWPPPAAQLCNGETDPPVCARRRCNIDIGARGCPVKCGTCTQAPAAAPMPGPKAVPCRWNSEGRFDTGRPEQTPEALQSSKSCPPAARPAACVQGHVAQKTAFGVPWRIALRIAAFCRPDGLTAAPDETGYTLFCGQPWVRSTTACPSGGLSMPLPCQGSLDCAHDWRACALTPRRPGSHDWRACALTPRRP